MNCIKYLFLGLVILFNLNANSQQYPSNVIWQMHLGTTEWDTPVELIEVENGYLIGGFYHWSETSTFQSNEIVIYKIDVNGEKIWRQEIDLGGDDVYLGITKTDDGGFLVLGKSYCGNVNSTTQNFLGNLHLTFIRCDSEGEVEWSRCFGTQGDDDLKFASQMDNGNLLFVGNFSGEYIDGDIDSTQVKGGKDSWFLCFDQEMSLQWQTIVGGSSKEQVIGNWIKPNGNLVAAIQVYSDDFDFQDKPEGVIYCFVEVNSTTGEVVGKEYIDDQDYIGFNLVYTSEGKRIWLGELGWKDFKPDGHHNLISGALQEDIFFRKENDDGSLEPYVFFGGSQREFLRRTKELENGNILLIGNTASSDGTLELSGNEGNSGWLIELDTLGNIINHTVYGKPGDDPKGEFLKDVIQLGDGNFLILISTNTEFPDSVYTQNIDGKEDGLGNGDIWILKTSDVFQGIQEAFGESLSVCSPNPTSGIFKIKSEILNPKKRLKYRLRGSKGEVILEINDGCQEFNISKMPNGVYYLEIIDGNGVVYTQKVLKQ